MNEAMSFAGGIGIAIEGTPGTAAARTDWLHALSESFSISQPEDVLQAIFHASEVQDSIPGLRQVQGNVVVPAYGGVGYGRLLALASRDTTSVALPYSQTVAPAGVPSTASGTLTAGTYRFKAAQTVLHAASGLELTTNPSPESAAIVLGGAGTITLTITPAAGTLPPGFANSGAIIYATNGDSGSEVAIAHVAAGVTEYVISAPYTPTTATPPTAMFLHKCGPGLSQPLSATFEMIMDNGSAHLFRGCYVNQSQYSVKPGERLQSTFDFLALHGEELTTPSTPAYSLVGGIHGKDAYAYVGNQGTTPAVQALINSFDVTLGNKAERRYRIGGGADPRAIRVKAREVKGSLDLDYETTAQLQNFSAKQALAVYLIAFGAQSTPGARVTLGGTTYYSWPYALSFDVPNVQYDSSTANLSGDNVVVQKLPFVARNDATKAFAFQLGFYTTANSLTA